MIEIWKKNSISSRAEWGAAILLTVLIVYLHVTFLRYAGAFWRDEINSIDIASLPSLSAIWATLHLDSFPLLSTLLIRLWSATSWGAGEFGLRLLGFLVGLAIIAVIWFDAFIFGRRAPLIALALFGFSSLLVRVGDSIRPYGLGIFLILLAFGLIWRVVESPTPRRVMAATLASILSVQCLYTNAFLILAIIIGAVAVTLRSRLLKRSILLVGIGGISALSLVPYLGTIQKAGQWIPLTHKPTTYRLIWDVLSKYTLGFASGYITITWYVLFGLGIFIAVRKTVTRKNLHGAEADRSLFLAVVMLAATLIFFVLYKNMQASPFPRYFLTPMAVVAVALNGLIGKKKDLWALGRIVVILFIVVLTFKVVTDDVRTRQTSVDLVAEKLEAVVSKDDMILVSPWFYGVAFQRYYNGAAPWMTLPPLKDLSIHRYDLLREQMVAADPNRDVIDGIGATLRGGGSVWLIGNLALDLYEGMAMPPPPPPAPNGLRGWKRGFYLWNWRVESLLYFMASRASFYQERFVVPRSMRVNPYERPRVLEVWGWREKQ